MISYIIVKSETGDNLIFYGKLEIIVSEKTFDLLPKATYCKFRYAPFRISHRVRCLTYLKGNASVLKGSFDNPTASFCSPVVFKRILSWLIFFLHKA